MKLASEKQISFANAISHLLQIPLPVEPTAQAYFLFIGENKEAFESIVHKNQIEAQEKREQKANEIIRKNRAKWDAEYDAFLKRSSSDEFSGFGSISTW